MTHRELRVLLLLDCFLPFLLISCKCNAKLVRQLKCYTCTCKVTNLINLSNYTHNYDKIELCKIICTEVDNVSPLM